MDTTITTSTRLLSSLPAFVAALRTMTPARFTLCALGQTPGELVPMYRISRNNGNGAGEAVAASRVISEVIERMRRLNDAYGEWQQFDIPAYFDLTTGQAACLVHSSERVSTVHITFYADLLLPSFQQLVRYWVETFAPAYAAMDQSAEAYDAFLGMIQPTLITHWQAVGAAIMQCRRLLLEDVSFLAVNGGQEERARWRQWWTQPPATGLDPRLTPELNQLPTLTLSLDFPLPAHRQPHRLQRLRRSRDRRRAERRRNRS